MARRPEHIPSSTGHEPVLLMEALALLALRPGMQVIDCTFGGGGYTKALLDATAPDGRVLALDADSDAVARAEELRSARSVHDRLTIVHASFDTVDQVAQEHGLSSVQGVVADLGCSSFQFDVSHRGFSFREDGPLDMRFDTSSGRPAWQWLAAWDADELERILRNYGEERHARRIAAAIHAAQRRSPITTTQELVHVIEQVVPRRGKIHPATRTFQALRIAVNDELGVLERAIPKMCEAVAPGGVIVIVSFHSLEDRIVKRAFRAAAKAGWGTVLTPKPITPSEAEQERNPRSRSAKLRAIRRMDRAQDSTGVSP